MGHYRYAVSPFNVKTFELNKNNAKALTFRFNCYMYQQIQSILSEMSIKSKLIVFQNKGVQIDSIVFAEETVGFVVAGLCHGRLRL